MVTCAKCIPRVCGVQSLLRPLRSLFVLERYLLSFHEHFFEVDFSRLMTALPLDKASFP